MSVTIRLQRQGAKKNPQFMVVAMDSMKKRDGEYLAKLGYYYPKAKTDAEKAKIDMEGIKNWIAKGAQLSEPVQQIFKKTAKSNSLN